jgi:hypothetical protein
MYDEDNLVHIDMFQQRRIRHNKILINSEQEATHLRSDDLRNAVERLNGELPPHR